MQVCFLMKVQNHHDNIIRTTEADCQWWTNNKELRFALPVVFFKSTHNLKRKASGKKKSTDLKFYWDIVDVVKLNGHSGCKQPCIKALKQCQGSPWWGFAASGTNQSWNLIWKFNLSNRSKSLKAYQVPKHCSCFMILWGRNLQLGKVIILSFLTVIAR